MTKCAPQLAIMQLGQAFQNFFARRAKYPVFRKKGVLDRFSLSNDQSGIEYKGKGSRIRIPNLGWVRMREGLRFIGKIIAATVSRVADRWFVSITVDTPEASRTPKTENITLAGGSTALVKTLLENRAWNTGSNVVRKLAGLTIAALGLYFISQPLYILIHRPAAPPI